MNEPRLTTALPPATPIRTRLREATRHLHVKAESLVRMPVTLDEHERTLARFYGFLEPWELLVRPALGATHEAFAADRWKSALIAADLIALGWSKDRIAALPRCENLPAIDDAPSALGSMYVFEGATLGGQVVAKHLRDEFGLTPATGGAFHGCYGRRTAEMWNAFQRQIAEASESNASAADSIVASACETFERVCEWFAGQDAPR